MFVKLSNELRETLNYNNDIVTWTELRERLKSTTETNDKLKELLKGSQFLAKLPSNVTPEALTNEQYSQLISPCKSPSDSRSEIAQLRSDLAELRRETTWLLNCFFSVIGVAVFVYFVASFYFERVETRLILSISTGLILFFIEVLLYIIRY